VDRITSLKPLSQAERRAIEKFLDNAVDLDGVLHNAVRALAQLTRNVAVNAVPVAVALAGTHMETVLLAPSRLMLVLITDTGRVEQRVVELPGPVEPNDVSDLRTTLNGNWAGCAWLTHPRSWPIFRDLCRDISVTWSPPSRRHCSRHSSSIRPNGGAGRIGQPDRAHPRLPGDPPGARGARGAGRPAEVARSAVGDWRGAGPDRERERLRGSADGLVVSAGYGSSGVSLGGLGVLGPRRMDYAQTMARVAAVAQYVGDLLAEQ